MIFQPGWPFTKLFNFHILRMRELGILHQKIMLHWTMNTEKQCEPNQAKSISLTQMAPLAVILLIGYFITFIVLFIECWRRKQYND